MAAIRRGEVWVVDFGLAAKVRPALLLTGSPADDELDLVRRLEHVKIGPATVKLERRLGALTPDEMERVDREVARQLGLSRDPTIISSAD